MSQELNSLNVDPSEGKKFRVKQQNVRLFTRQLKKVASFPAGCLWFNTPGERNQ